MAKFIQEDKVYQIQGKLAVLICNAALEENPLKALILLENCLKSMRRTQLSIKRHLNAYDKLQTAQIGTNTELTIS